jgi:hypothetical protein
MTKHEIELLPLENLIILQLRTENYNQKKKTTAFYYSAITTFFSFPKAGIKNSFNRT